MSNRRPGYRQVSQDPIAIRTYRVSLDASAPSYVANRGYHMRLFMLMIPTLEILGAAMANILFLVFCFDILLYAASQFNGRGQMWADLICSNSFGTCTHPNVLLFAIIPLFIATFLAHKNRQN